MSKVYTGSEAIQMALGLVRCDETKVLCDIQIDSNRVTVYEFIGDYYMANIHCCKPDLCIFEKITKEEADNIVSNIRGLSHIGTYFEFGGF